MAALSGRQLASAFLRASGLTFTRIVEGKWLGLPRDRRLLSRTRACATSLPDTLPLLSLYS